MTAAKDTRIAQLEGHRNQWRRVAFRLYEELRKYEPEKADAIIEVGAPEELKR